MGLTAAEQALEGAGPPVKLSVTSGRDPRLGEGVAKLGGSFVLSPVGHLVVATWALANTAMYDLVTRGAWFEPARGAVDRIGLGMAVVLGAILLVLRCHAELPALRAGQRTQTVSTHLLVLLAAGILVGATALGLMGPDILPPALMYILPGFFVLAAAEECARLRVRRAALRCIGFALPDEAAEGSKGGETTGRDLGPGDTCELSAGRVAPCDGEILSGTAEIDERRFSGLTERKFKGRGQVVYAGSLIRRGGVVLRVQNSSADSLIQSTATLLNAGVSRELTSGRDLSGVLNGLVLFLAGCAAVYWHDEGRLPHEIALVAATVLLAGLPLQYLGWFGFLRAAAMTGLFSRGALVQSAEHLEAAAGVRSLVLDHGAVGDAQELAVASFTILDERLDERAVVSAILALLARLDDPFARTATRYLCARVTEPECYEVADFHEWPGQGIAGAIAGAEISIGTEVFLIERGVQIQASEVEDDSADGQSVYVALNEELVARFVVTDATREGASRTMDRLHHLGVRAVLCSAEPQAKADRVGQALTLELVNIAGGLSLRHYEEKLRELAPVGIYGGALLDPRLVAAAKVSLEQFDEVRFNLSDRSIVLLERRFSLLPEILTTARRLARSRSVLRVAAAAGGAAVVLGGAAGVVSPPGALAIAALYVLLPSLLLWQLHRGLSGAAS